MSRTSISSCQPSSKMSNCLTRKFRAHLTTTMDSVLRTAVLEIMQTFENSLHDHQIELAQKEEEIAQLKITLQRTEIMLRETVECLGDSEAEKTKTQMNETQTELKDVLNASGQTADDAEIDFVVPDDWCAPLGCETVSKQDDGACPSVRLRSLYIPLQHCPVIKQKVIDFHQQKSHSKKPKTDSSSTEKRKHIQDVNSSLRDGGRTRLRRDMKVLLKDRNHEDTDLTGRPAGLQRGMRNLTGKDQKNTFKSKKEERKIATTECKSTEQETRENGGGKRHACKFCEKGFDTPFGLSVHERSHKKCRGCRKQFPFLSSLRCHKPFCAKLNKLLLKEGQSTDPPKPHSSDEVKPVRPSKKQVIIEKESTPSLSNHSEASIRKSGPTKNKNGPTQKKNGPTQDKKYSCPDCNRKCHSQSRLRDHIRVHTGEKPYHCSMCPKKFRIKQSLSHHMMRMHKDHVNSSEINGDLVWTKPLEVIEGSGEDLISPRENRSRAINHDKKHNPAKKPGERWQTMGTWSADGYICLLCKKLSKSKYLLIEHYRIHTGEKPLKCNRCPAKFRFRGQLSTHKKKCRNTAIQCEKKFPSQMILDKRVSRHHKDRHHFCKVCGKGFITEGRLERHMERHE